MKIDLFKLNNLGEVHVDDDVVFDHDMYEGSGVRDILNCHISGKIFVSYDEEVELSLNVKGTFILPCAITLEDVSYDFETDIEEIAGKFDDFYQLNKNRLDILPFVWENIVSEVPIRVVKEGVTTELTNGEGWELVSDN